MMEKFSLKRDHEKVRAFEEVRYKDEKKLLSVLESHLDKYRKVSEKELLSTLKRLIERTIDDKEVKKHYKFKFKDKWRMRRKPDQTYLITMRYNNGTCRQFILPTLSRTFRHGKKTYYIDFEEQFFSITHGQNALEYHENFPVPINREVLLQGSEAFYNVTPENLKSLVGMEYVKVLTNAQELSKYLKFGLLLTGVTLLGIIVLGFQLYQMTKGG